MNNQPTVFPNEVNNPNYPASNTPFSVNPTQTFATTVSTPPTTVPNTTSLNPNQNLPNSTNNPQPNNNTNRETANNPNSTQNSLQIAELRDGVVILKDGTFRAVIGCESINFDLMSPNEREGVEYAYQNFLNSLYFPIQILIRSQRVDIGPYLDKLLKLRNQQDNMLLNVLMDDYINYIDLLAQEANIMDKSFFIVVPYLPAGDILSAKNQITGIFSKVNNKPITNVKINDQVYTKAKDEINNRVNLVISGLAQVGIRSERLSTQKLSQLYYNFYNPDTALQQPLVNFEQITNLYSKKGTNNPEIKG